MFALKLFAQWKQTFCFWVVQKDKSNSPNNSWRPTNKTRIILENFFGPCFFFIWKKMEFCQHSDVETLPVNSGRESHFGAGSCLFLRAYWCVLLVVLDLVTQTSEGVSGVSGNTTPHQIKKIWDETKKTRSFSFRNVKFAYFLRSCLVGVLWILCEAARKFFSARVGKTRHTPGWRDTACCLPWF